MRSERVFIGLGSNTPDAKARLDGALAFLDRGGCKVAAAGRYVRGPYEGDAHAPAVLNSVAEIRTALPPHEVLDRLLEIEAQAGRVRDGGTTRALDLDLLTYGDEVIADERLRVPHPRLAERAFVLGPFEEIGPTARVPDGSGGAVAVAQLAMTLRRDAPERFDALEAVASPAFRNRGVDLEILEDQAALRTWRAAQRGVVGVVPTMGALHAGHASLVQRAAAACDAVVATLFVNPLQYGPDEDFDRYPRAFDTDCALLARHGASAVYAPATCDLFPPGFDTYIEPGAAARNYEGVQRPTHFRGVCTVVAKLWARTRPDLAYFGRKDAQQLAVLRHMIDDLDMPGRIVACQTVRALDGLALSSRNAYLAADERRVARTIAAVLEFFVREVAGGALDCAALIRRGRGRLEAAGLEVDYLDIVDQDDITPISDLAPAATPGAGKPLVLVAARLGAVRLIDNRAIVLPLPVAVGSQ